MGIYRHQNLRFYKTDPGVKSPVFATEGAACFDLHAHILEDAEIVVYHANTGYKEQIPIEVDRLHREEQNRIAIRPGGRVLVPTGLIFDIRPGWSVRLHARSGMVLKEGMALANGEGIIDSDYVEPVYAMITNVSTFTRYIENDQRICQGEMVQNALYSLEEITEAPTKKGNRDGGFGSTGNSQVMLRQEEREGE